MRMLNIQGGDDNMTPLITAAAKGYLEMVKVLVENEAELDRKDKEGRTALAWAEKNEHDLVVSYLISQGASK